MDSYDGRKNKDIKEADKARAELIKEDPSLKKFFDHPLNANKV